MPHLDTSTYASQLFWLFVTYLTIYIAFARFILPRISGILENRSKRINNDKLQAEKVIDEGKALEEKYEKRILSAKEKAKRKVVSAREKAENVFVEEGKKLDKSIQMKLDKGCKDIEKKFLEENKNVPDLSKKLSSTISSLITSNNK